MNSSKKHTLILLVIILILIVAGGFIYFKKPNIKLPFPVPEGIKNLIQKNNQGDNKKLIAEVGKLIQLPTGEDPIIGVVTDASKLQDQPFFKKGKNGDSIFFYTVSKKVILYDPVANQIVDVAPIVIASSSAQVVLAKIALWNGTSTTGLVTKVEGEINKNFSQVNIVNRDNTNHDNYDKTIVVVFTDSARQSASSLAKALNATVSDLPAGEMKPSGVDILVIIGKDKI